jgi:iron-sulfur cluster repair protein YtfE (RIC family)
MLRPIEKTPPPYANLIRVLKINTRVFRPPAAARTPWKALFKAPRAV